jgi:hypothetical protein
VAARVQHDDVAGRNTRQIGTHRGVVQPACRRIVVAIGIDLETCPVEQRAMVVPGRVADPDLGLGCEPAQEIGAELESTGAAERLHRHRAPGCDAFSVGAEQQRLHRFVVGREAIDGQIRARRCLVGKIAFGAPHALEQRHLAGVVVVHTYTEIHLVGIGVGIERLGDAEDRVAGSKLDGGKHGG